jgi:hypothetical protein
MSIQFKHTRHPNKAKGGATFAVNIDSIDLSKLQVDDVIDIPFGMSICSEKDCFNKKVGRDLAVSRLKKISFKVAQTIKSRLENENLTSVISLKHDDFYLRFNQSSESSKFHLICVVVF